MARDKFSSSFAVVVRKHRQRIGLSQETLAERASIHRTYVGMLERGERTPTIDVAAQLAGALGLPLDALVAEAQGEYARNPPTPPRRKRRRS